jgi:predicted aminopeptidase
MRNEKQVVFDKLRSDYYALKISWDNPPDYDKWMEHDLNNAKIASVVTYHDLAGSFSTLLSLSDNDLALFYERVRFLGFLSKEDRHECLQNLSKRCYGK